MRRTSTIDVTRPGGQDAPAVYDCHARDIATGAAGDAPSVLAEDRARVVAQHRVILEVASDPPRATLPQLVGARAGGHLRAALDAALPDERTAGTPLYLLLDDIAGASLVSGWSWSQWTDEWLSQAVVAAGSQVSQMAGVCIGFRPGSAVLGVEGRPRMGQNTTRVPPLPHPGDPAGWHTLVDRGGVNFRRARRIDVWRERGLIHIDGAFQDSASAPDGGERVAIHEYSLVVTADAETMTLLSVSATPGTLPYAECPAAPSNIAVLLGTPLRDLRTNVLVALRKTAGCTHLNDALRALAEVPILALSASSG